MTFDDSTKAARQDAAIDALARRVMNVLVALFAGRLREFGEKPARQLEEVVDEELSNVGLGAVFDDLARQPGSRLAQAEFVDALVIQLRASKRLRSTIAELEQQATAMVTGHGVAMESLMPQDFSTIKRNTRARRIPTVGRLLWLGLVATIGATVSVLVKSSFSSTVRVCNSVLGDIAKSGSAEADVDCAVANLFYTLSSVFLKVSLIGLGAVLLALGVVYWQKSATA